MHIRRNIRKSKQTVSIKHTNGSKAFSKLKIRGIANGPKIKYKELGDKKYEDLPGDLTATVKILFHKIFTQEGDDLKMHLTISAWNAIIGTTIQLKTIEQKILNFKYS